jgi:carbonic anhydrase
MKRFLVVLLLSLNLITANNTHESKQHNQTQQDTHKNSCCCTEQTRRKLAPCDPHQEVFNQDNSPSYAAVIAANAATISTYIPQPDFISPKKVALLTCMDYRLDPDQFMGLEAAKMYVIRNAGGLATDDALRSLIISYKLLGVEEFYVVQHTDCGMQKFTNKVMVELLEGSLVTATLIKNCNITLHPLQDNNVCKWINTSKCCGKRACIDYNCIDWLTIDDGMFHSVVDSVRTIRNHPLIPSNIPIYGFIFDVITGELIPVKKAMKIGRATPLVCKK